MRALLALGAAAMFAAPLPAVAQDAAPQDAELAEMTETPELVGRFELQGQVASAVDAITLTTHNKNTSGLRIFLK